MAQQKHKQELNLFTKVINWRQRVLVTVSLSLLVTLLLLDWTFVRYRLLDQSMAPVFWSGQKVVTLRWAYLFHPPKLNDMIIYSSGKGAFLPGRVIATAGDSACVINGIVFVNGNELFKADKTNVSIPEIRVPYGFVCIWDQPTSEQPGRLTLVPFKLIKGKILGKWQVLII